jgi:hypothetical protein
MRLRRFSYSFHLLTTKGRTSPVGLGFSSAINPSSSIFLHLPYRSSIGSCVSSQCIHPPSPSFLPLLLQYTVLLSQTPTLFMKKEMLHHLDGLSERNCLRGMFYR